MIVKKVIYYECIKHIFKPNVKASNIQHIYCKKVNQFNHNTIYIKANQYVFLVNLSIFNIHIQHSILSKIE